MAHGKSTVLKIIAKQEYADFGSVNIRNGARIGILNQIYENEKDDILVKDFLESCFENVFLLEKSLRKLEKQMILEPENQNLLNEYGKKQEKLILLGGYEIQEKLSKICTKFHIDNKMLKQNYNSLSGGEKTRINLAKLILTEPDILLLDEPTNHLDIDSLEFLEELLMKYKGTILIVSHDRYFLDKVVT